MRTGIDDGELLYRSIGNTVVAFQQLEDMLASGLCSMMKLRDEDHNQIIGSSMGFRQKVDLFAALQRRQIQDDLVPLCRMACIFFLTAEEFRNTVVHTHYSVALGEKSHCIRWVGEKATIRGAKGVKHRKKIIKISIIEEGAETIRRLCVSAMTFRHLHSTTPDLTKTLEEGIACLKRRPF